MKIEPDRPRRRIRRLLLSVLQWLAVMGLLALWIFIALSILYLVAWMAAFE